MKFESKKLAQQYLDSNTDLKNYGINPQYVAQTAESFWVLSRHKSNCACGQCPVLNNLHIMV